MKKIILLGATGSIGTSTLEVLSSCSKDFKLIGIGLKEDYEKANQIISKFKSIKLVYILKNQDKIKGCKTTSNIEDIIKLDKDVLIVNAISGIDGLKPTLLAIRNNLDIALANKECIVCAGDLINSELKHSKSHIYPIDSEHNAIKQCLKGEKKEDVRNLILTCSGGPFREYSNDELYKVTLTDALKHPTWNMGQKISIDSATLFNKGMEIIEAHYLFDIDYSKIKVVIHKESIIHSLVEYNDGSIKALVSKTTMKLPIRYSLYCEDRKETLEDYLDLTKIGSLNFSSINPNMIKAIDLAYEVGKQGGNKPLVYCVSNEIAVNAFIEGKVKFLDIYKIVEYIVDNTNFVKNVNEKNIFELINDVRCKTTNYINDMKGE